MGWKWCISLILNIFINVSWANSLGFPMQRSCEFKILDSIYLYKKKNLVQIAGANQKRRVGPACGSPLATRGRCDFDLPQCMLGHYNTVEGRIWGHYALVNPRKQN